MSTDKGAVAVDMDQDEETRYAGSAEPGCCGGLNTREKLEKNFDDTIAIGRSKSHSQQNASNSERQYTGRF